ncbi:hypothetical protein [Microlunatus parietis]|uniref:Uncharacterized protein n=1 Tax=Microlunatus parietis TaxID=682979 RepID=A0A7Y9IE74_9ACTN|nr:hypothetical protein [Microlunatus parietis]NYE75189.1 hypothetical protein [Microlunatus parietis]
MYLMPPETPREEYAKLLVSRAEERVAHRLSRRRREFQPPARVRAAWRSLTRILLARRSRLVARTFGEL